MVAGKARFMIADVTAILAIEQRISGSGEGDQEREGIDEGEGDEGVGVVDDAIRERLTIQCDPPVPEPNARKLADDPHSPADDSRLKKVLSSSRRRGPRSGHSPIPQPMASRSRSAESPNTSPPSHSRVWFT